MGSLKVHAALFVKVFEFLFCLASGFTSFVGLRALTGWSWLAVLVPVVANQGMLYASAHPRTTSSTTPRGNKYYKSPRLFVWGFCFTVSVWFSAIGLFELQRGKLDVNTERAELQQVWERAAAEINRFRADAGGYIEAKRADLDRAITAEEWKIGRARARKLDYSRRRRDELKRQRDRLGELEERVRSAAVINPADASTDSRDIRTQIASAYARVSDVYGQMDEDFRQNAGHKQPEAPREELLFTNPYDSLAEQLRQRSWQAIFCVLLALGFDLVPTFNVLSRTPMRSPASIIRDFFASAGEVKHAIWGAKTAFRNPARLERLRVVVEGHDWLGTDIEFGTDTGEPYLRDLEHHFASIEGLVGDTAGQQMRIISRTSSAGMELLPDVPLTFQLEKDRIIRLRVEAQTKETAK